MSVDTTQIDLPYLMTMLKTLGAIHDCEGDGIRRVLWTKPDMEARAWFAEEVRKAGFTLRTDALGTMFVRLEGTDPSLPAVATGSHTDALPNSGIYDGTVGVLGGLAVLKAIRDAGIRPRRSLELIAFTSEEPTRFGYGCLSSRLMFGAATPDQLRALVDYNGVPFETVRSGVGFTAPLESAVLRGDEYSHYLELHIEQYHRLEREKLDIGVVTGIVASSTTYFHFEGPGGHAGAVPMKERHSAIQAAFRFGVSVEDLVDALGTPLTVGTVGLFDALPKASNGIPTNVTMTVDIRDLDTEARDTVLEAVIASADSLARQYGVKLRIDRKNADRAALADEGIMLATEASCEALGVKCRRMHSAAFHDAGFAELMVRMGMIFIPCLNGKSHVPEEFSTPQEIEIGANVLLSTMLTLANQLN